MESLVAGTLAGAGSFRCRQCGHVVTLAAHDRLTDCPDCGARSFARASLFEVFEATRPRREELPAAAEEDARGWLDEAREGITQPGVHLAWREGDDVHVVALTRERTRVGRSLAADVRFDDPTVSRRHALIVRQDDGLCLLDDRSLNGVFVNGQRVEWRGLQDGDEIVLGRYHLHVLDLTSTEVAQRAEARDAG